MMNTASNYYLRGGKARKEGLKEITVSHLVTPAPTYYYVLISKGYGDCESTFALQRTNNDLVESEKLLEHSKPNVTSLTIQSEAPISSTKIESYVNQIADEFRIDESLETDTIEEKTPERRFSSHSMTLLNQEDTKSVFINIFRKIIHHYQEV